MKAIKPAKSLRATMRKQQSKDPHVVHLGQLGGRARSQKLTAEQRKEIASKAARARWATKKKNKASQ